MASQLDIYGGEEPYGPRPGPDGDLAARLERQQQNRDRIVGSPAGRDRTMGRSDAEPYSEDADPHTVDMTREYGIRNVFREVFLDRRNKVPFTPHDSTPFRKAGVDREVPTFGPDAITTMQDKVSPDRVAELVDDPSSGHDVRFPTPERALSVQLPVTPEGGGRAVNTDVLWNGNHRLAAARERNEMFLPVRSIQQDAMPEAKRAFSRGNQLYDESRYERNDLQGTRMVRNDATIKKGMGGRVQAYINY